jgi:hypothetical protein
VQVLGVGDHDTAFRAQHDLAGLERRQPGEPVAVDDLVAAGRHGEQVGVIRRRPRAHEVQPGGFDAGLVVFGVLAGVVDHGQFPARGGEGPEAPGQLGHHRGKPGDIGPVARIGVRHQRDAAVDRHHQAQAHQAQIGALLLGVASLGDRGNVSGPASRRVEP